MLKYKSCYHVFSNLFKPLTCFESSELIIVFMCAEEQENTLQPEWNKMEIQLWFYGLGFCTLWKSTQEEWQQEWSCYQGFKGR